MQDTAERAWAARDKLTDHEQAPAWLRRILVNRLRDLARRRALIAFSALETAGAPPDITVEDPLAVLQAVEREGQLRAALAHAPRRRAARAAICACSTEAAHKRLQRGRMRLTGALAVAAGSEPATVDETCHSARQLASAYLDRRRGRKSP